MELLRKKLATVAILFAMAKEATKADFVFSSDVVPVDSGKEVVITIEIRDAGVVCDPDSR